MPGSGRAEARPPRTAAGRRALYRYAAAVADETLGERLEMLLVLQWLDDGAPDDGAVALSVPTAAVDLGLENDRAGLLAVMGALGDLESRGVARTEWPGVAGRDAIVILSGPVRRDARRLFGGR